MSGTSVTYRVHMDIKTFRAFALYDTFRLKKHARLPIGFFLIMTAFSVIALCSGKPQSGLIAGVLWLIGLGMPSLYAGTFLGQIRKQGREFRLEKPRLVYTGTLTRDEITVHNELKPEEDQHLEWDRLYRVVRRKGCFYLYAVPSKAFLLPDADADCGAAEACRFIQACLPGKKQR